MREQKKSDNGEMWNGEAKEKMEMCAIMNTDFSFSTLQFAAHSFLC